MLAGIGAGYDQETLLLDMQRYFAPQSLARGQRYWQEKRVLSCDLADTDTILGVVKGSLRIPYQTEVYLSVEDNIIFETFCSCPVQVACKHAVALLLEFQIQHQASMKQEIEQGLVVDPTLKTIIQLLEDEKSNERQILGEKNRNRAERTPEKSTREILYVIDRTPSGALKIEIQSVFIKKDNVYGSHAFISLKNMSSHLISYIQPADEQVCRFWQKVADRTVNDTNLPDEPELILLLLRKLLATGRCVYQSKYNAPLKQGPDIEGKLVWQKTSDDLQRLVLETDSHHDILLSCAPMYVDRKKNEIGLVKTGLTPDVLGLLCELPPFDARRASAAREFLLKKNAQMLIPLPEAEAIVEEKFVDPIPRLRLFSSRPDVTRKTKINDHHSNRIELSFVYPGLDLDERGRPLSKRLYLDEEKKKVSIEKPRPVNVESFVRELAKQGLYRTFADNFDIKPNTENFVLRYKEDWPEFLYYTKILADKGWIIEIDPSLPYQIVQAEDEWEASVEEDESWWFSLNLGIKVNGKAINLIPILMGILQSTPGRFSIEKLEKSVVDGNMMIPLPDGNLLELPFERVKAILSILVELFAMRKFDPKKGVELPAPALAALLESKNLRWFGDGLSKLERVADMLKKLRSIPLVEPPKNLKAKLRNYQIEGLSFLEYLSQNQLGGILADDMGLGKTVQTLAHLLIQKKEGRTSLVVCPTSVLPNWIKEVQKLAPDLSVLALRGADRRYHFSELSKYDLVVTTYPLLPRDIEVMKDQNWWCVVLDESQFIKNHQTAISEAVCKLRANHKICLTGTPVENHLGEAWSQFSFLLPGLLGDPRYFKEVFRTPIEKLGDESVRRVLAARLRPFMLRRTKEEVLSELPEKEIIIDPIVIDGPQRDLYEAVRVSMYERVKQEIASKGIMKSQIIILDALLKLRQVCCHPKLLKLETAKKVTSSTKLNYLVEKLENLIEEGRQILLFSQFTSMLDLIKPELESRDIKYVELCGSTKDRITPVEKFQAGEVPLFLISLKAGGFGLNLTAADTVIHYDPWWNPAVENQATDRAHRIGQTKKVFVYKLIAEGTIEVRMLELQERKRELASAIFDPEKSNSIKFDEEDIKLLFEPI